VKRKILLYIDASINFILGMLLLSSVFLSTQLTRFLGVPTVEQAFYPSILGGVFIGITVALLLEANRTVDFKPVGLGLMGAVVINLCGGSVLLCWLVFGNLGLPMHGRIFLWILSVLLVGLSGIELFQQLQSKG
jgi:hypothetical protein